MDDQRKEHYVLPDRTAIVRHDSALLTQFLTPPMQVRDLTIDDSGTTQVS
jgi:hypothetical protein